MVTSPIVGDAPGADPLYRHTMLSHRVTYPVLGHTVRYGTNSEQVLAHIDESYGYWRELPPDSRSTTAFDLDVVLHDGDEHGQAPRFTYRMPRDNRLLIATCGSHAVVELDRNLAYAYVTSELVQHGASLRSGILDAMTLMLTTSVDRCPIHAAAVQVEGRLLLLIGASGSGKSTLAYILLAEGYDVLSDDTVYVQMHPEPRVWHVRRPVTLLPSVAAEFSELRNAVPRLLPTGKTKVLVPAPKRMSPGPFVGTPIVCLLRRGDKPTLAPLAPSEIYASLTDEIEPGFALLAEQRVPVAKWLSANGGWEFTLSSRAEAALPLVKEILAS